MTPFKPYALRTLIATSPCIGSSTGVLDRKTTFDTTPATDNLGRINHGVKNRVQVAVQIPNRNRTGGCPIVVLRQCQR